MRVAQFIARVLGAKSRPIRRVKRHGIIWNLDLRETIDLSIYLTGYFQRSVVKQLAREAPTHGVIIDIGANRGSVAVALANLNSTYKIFAVEPVSQLVDKITQLLEDNPDFKKRVFIEQMFLSSPGGVAGMELPSSVDASWNLFPSDGQNPITGATALPLASTPVVTLDDFVSDKRLERLDIIKLDVEGYELDVLLGGKRCIDAFRPVVLMEWNPYLVEIRGYLLSDLEDFWSSHKYLAYQLRTNRPPIRIEWKDLMCFKKLSHVDLMLKPTHMTT